MKITCECGYSDSFSSFIISVKMILEGNVLNIKFKCPKCGKTSNLGIDSTLMD